ncbi:MAG: leucyl aminopeptidase [Burkholderiaceae bacterium]
MQFSTKTSAPERVKTACVIVPVHGGKTLGAGGAAIDAACGKKLGKAIAAGDLDKKAGATLLLPLEGPAARALLVSAGDESPVSERTYRKMAAAAVRELRQLPSGEAFSLLHETPVAGRELDWKLRCVVMAAREAAYRFDAYKSKKDDSGRGVTAIVLGVGAAEAAAANALIEQTQALCDGIDLAKDLGNTPPNVCTPTYLADTARALARSHKLKVDVLDARKMESLGMGALLAVAKGSAEPPRLITLTYQGAGAKAAPVVLVGKGVTFDTGGISLKPAADMDEMKYDMCGAASVLGTLRAVAQMKLKLNVVGIIPTVENMPGGSASRPGDIVTSMSGQTIEILNTDAEGRLILCDALTYAERFKPAAVVDIATLTGACVIALGAHHSGLFSSNDALADELSRAGREAGDPCWRMPLDDEYQDQIKSPFADMANVGGRAAGSVTAACFLSRFTKPYAWAHLDIAGTAWRSGASKGSSGRPVPLLTRFLIDRASQ